jgi:hypothetical protein
MTDEALRQRRDAAYAERGVQLRLIAAVLAAAESTGLGPEDRLPESLQSAHDAYSRRINELDGELASLDRQIEREQNR